MWPQRAGDARIADDLALGGPGIRSERLELYFDGGDFCADDRTVFVAPSVLRRNLQRTVCDREELLDLLARLLGRRVMLFDEAPDHHVAMYMTPVGDGTVLVGDPALAEEILLKNGEERPICCPTGGGDDFTPATRARFDAVAAQCAAAGYRVVRIPVVPGCDGRTWLTWVNVVMDQRGGRRIVYLPRYGKVAALDAAAAEVWRGLGYEVHPVDCSAVYPNFGSLGCLVNVLRRG
jgi:N-dimethylarginine dimethylaminohydrolase